ncbi:ATP-binding protein [Aquibacillus rhizosphaerae]|uniref:histidine kinase n=1 Tax=Aquibacillus rhizosphaerae TaxID=3051431 RepID=A0ABT7L772_9BACI|nr:ATP-binding protein [Aquibacillus sp. LR5S19]MDL4840445.1 ATP-binding protein [Aquibacillus sp. LR5S19]
MGLSNDMVVESNLRHNSLSNGGHIIYVFNNEKKYIVNAVNYIIEGLLNDEGVIFVDSNDRINRVKAELRNNNISDQLLNQITFAETDTLYNADQPSPSVEDFISLANPYLKGSIPLRTWRNVQIKDMEKLIEYECDTYICDYHIFSVCAYDGRSLSALLLTEMLSVHEYLMTDDSLVPSNLYGNQSQSSPSIIDQIKLEKSADNVLMRSEQLTFAGQFSAGICHEIRNPLTTIKGFFQLLREDNHNKMYYQVIEQELERIQQITSELLLLAKPHSEERENHNLIDVVKEVYLLLESQAVMKSIAIKTNLKQDKLIVECDDTKIKQVIINIVKNAIEIMDKGIITIEIDQIDGFAILKIIDEGPGIPKEVLKKIGEPFFTTKKEGTGLGLIISFNIIKSHGGKVQIDSDEGVGTTFTFTLPLVNEGLDH